MPGPVAEAAAMTLAATIGTAPLLALHFEQVSPASLPANLLAAPAVAPIMWLGMLAAAAAQVSPGARRAAQRARRRRCSPTSRWLAHAAGAAPGPRCRCGSARRAVLGARVRGAGCAVLAAALRVVGGRLAAAGGRACARRPALAAVGGAGAPSRSPCSAGAPRSAPAPGELVVSFLDIGQGDATLIQRGGASVLFDTGPPDGPIVRRLREAGVERLDALVLTHAEADHEGAALPVMRAFPPRLLLDGGAGWPTARAARAARGARARAASAGSPPAPARRSRSAACDLRVLWPPPRRRAGAAEGDPNDRARRRAPSARALRPAAARRRRVRRHRRAAAARVEALKVAHHGSADPGLPALLERAAARGRGDRGRRARTPTATRRRRRWRPCAPSRTSCRTDRDGTVRLRVSRRARCDWSARVRRCGRESLGRRLDSAAVPAFKAAYLIHGDDHGRIAERRARLRAMAEAETGIGGRRGVRGRRLHAGGGRRRAVGDDVRDRPPVRDRRRRRALEGRRGRAGGRARWRGWTPRR